MMCDKGNCQSLRKEIVESAQKREAAHLYATLRCLIVGREKAERFFVESYNSIDNATTWEAHARL
jgi:hypothetical protein